jgi:hypothetical protein
VNSFERPSTVRPFVVDSTAATVAFSIESTSTDQALLETIAWGQLGQAA